MSYTEQQRIEALHLLDLCGSEKNWNRLVQIAECMFSEPTPEEKVKYEAEDRKRAEANAQRKAAAANVDERFSTWKSQKLGLFKVTNSRYGLNVGECKTIVDYLLTHRTQPGTILGTVCDVFDYGFKKGQACQKAEEKKKAALHAANMKNGPECSTDKI